MTRSFSFSSFLLASILLMATLYPVFTASAVSPIVGQTIAIDAGHDSASIGTTGICVRDDGTEIEVPEYMVNEAVRSELVSLLAAGGAIGYEVAQLATRKERVTDAESSEASVLISIHHNGSTNVGADYTKFFVTQKNDKELANAIYPGMVAALESTGKGIKSDGYGMTVYGSLPGVLTESCFITNTDRACEFLDNDTTDIVGREAQALYDGLELYFAGQSSEGSGGGGKEGGKGRNR